VVAPPVVTTPEQPAREYERATLADAVAHEVPSAPGAGLFAQLASSPFASAIRHIVPSTSAPTFDVRALFGSSVGATYLAGLLGDSPSEVSITPAMPAWAPASARGAIEWEPSYVAADTHTAGDIAGADETPAREPSREDVAPAVSTAAAALTTLHSALLSWDVETLPTGETRSVLSSSSHAATPMTPARMLVESMTMPMIDPISDRSGDVSYAAPGMLADRAQAWSIAQERSASDLAFDFVTPELVLAARVYGLGPAEAAQAARLAIAGPGQLSAMAGHLDRTFVQAMAIEAEQRRDGAPRFTTAYPVVSAAPAVPGSEPYALVWSAVHRVARSCGRPRPPRRSA
jgi:hypothetical protein